MVELVPECIARELMAQMLKEAAERWRNVGRYVHWHTWPGSKSPDDSPVGEEYRALREGRHVYRTVPMSFKTS